MSEIRYRTDFLFPGDKKKFKDNPIGHFDFFALETIFSETPDVRTVILKIFPATENTVGGSSHMRELNNYILEHNLKSRMKTYDGTIIINSKRFPADVQVNFQENENPDINELQEKVRIALSAFLTYKETVTETTNVHQMLVTSFKRKRK